jgi:hypothetical protein
VSPSAVLVGPDPRRQATFGGIVPTTASARGGETMVCALAVEHHAEGAALPLLVLSSAPGLLGWDPVAGLTAHDDRGREYAVRALGHQSSLGAMQATMWISPGVPADALALVLTVRGLVRTSVGRGGGGVQRPLSGGPWVLEIPLLPSRTATAPPAEPSGQVGMPDPASAVPTRTLAGLVGLAPVGQARLLEDAAVCLWGLERYADRSVLTVSVLADAGAEVRPIAPGHGRVDAWDDRGRRYLPAPVHGTGGPGWSESSIELVPALDPAARALAVRLADVPCGPGATVPGPLVFGIALPGSG